MKSLLDILGDSGCLKEGHTAFRNGFHGNGWIDKSAIVRNPRILDSVAKLQAEVVTSHFPDVEMLVAPIVDGAILASFIARHLGLEFAMTDKWQDGTKFHKTNVPKPPKRVVFIEDLVFTGESVEYNIEFLRPEGFEILGITAWLNRQVKDLEGLKTVSLLDKSPYDFYSLDKCPLCKLNEPIKYEDVRE